MNKQKQTYRVELMISGSKKVSFFDQDAILIGRLPHCDLVIEDTNISREHAKIIFKGFQGLLIEDLKSSNGTLLNGKKIPANSPTTFVEKDLISFGNSNAVIKVYKVELTAEVVEQVEDLERQVQENSVHVQFSGYTHNDEQLKLDFKHVGLDIAKSRTPAEEAQAVIREAEFLKHSLIKNAEAQQQKIINEIKIRSKEISDTSYDLYKKNVKNLIEETKQKLSEIRLKTEIDLADKKKTAYSEIDEAWRQHKEAINAEKQALLNRVEQENDAKLSLKMELIKVEATELKEKALKAADEEIQSNTLKYKNQFEVEKKEHDEQLRLVLVEKSNCEAELKKLSEKVEGLRTEKTELELEIGRLEGNKTTAEYAVDLLEKKNESLQENYTSMQTQLESFIKKKNEIQQQEKEAQQNYDKVKSQYNDLVSRKQSIEQQVSALDSEISDKKTKNKMELEQEFQNIKKAEQEKLEHFKNHELQELKKIRLQHAESLKKMSLDLSQEISSKMELFLKKDDKSFNFEKAVELINSVIQVKAGAESGQSSEHEQQIHVWRSRASSERRKHLSMGFVMAFVVYFSSQALYTHFTQDSFKETQRRLASEREIKRKENIYNPVKTDTYHADYVNATIYTKDFVEVYLDPKIQQEWVKKITYYFVDKWKVPEETTIKVVSNSKSLVENINQAVPELQKDRIKQSLEKMGNLEKENITAQAKLLGSKVRYEAYKRMEKEFFLKKLKQRSVAGE